MNYLQSKIEEIELTLLFTSLLPRKLSEEDWDQNFNQHNSKWNSFNTIRD